jgi:hypothetical protein
MTKQEEGYGTPKRADKLREPLKEPRKSKGISLEDEREKKVSFRSEISINNLLVLDEEREDKKKAYGLIKDNVDPSIFEQDLETLGVDEEHSGNIVKKILDEKYKSSEELEADFIEGGLAIEDAQKASDIFFVPKQIEFKLFERANSFVAELQKERANKDKVDCLACTIM